MCGRYTLKVSHRPDLSKLGLQQGDRYNIAPQSSVVVIDEGEAFSTMRWDYSPVWAKTPMHISNARSETLREKPSFRDAKRCVLVADGWYEWQRSEQGKQPWYHHCQGELLFFAGICNDSSGCAIVTREAHSNIAHIHHRQPVLLEGRAVPGWLAGHDLFASAMTRDVQCYPVSKAVNSPRNDNATLIEEVEPELEPLNSAGEVGDLFGG